MKEPDELTLLLNDASIVHAQLEPICGHLRGLCRLAIEADAERTVKRIQLLEWNARRLKAYIAANLLPLVLEIDQLQKALCAKGDDNRPVGPS